MKSFKLISLFFLLFVVSCYSDKGNYDYNETPDLKIENINDQYVVLSGAEKLTITPKVTSSSEGILEENNPNYAFSYRINIYDSENKSYWKDLYTGVKDLDVLAKIPTGDYKLQFRVTDTRSGVFTSYTTKLQVTSNVYEGWLILCNEGSENRTRLDMVSYISADRVIPTYDLMSVRGLPADTKGSYGIGFYPNPSAETMDKIYLMSDSKAYLLDKKTFNTSEKSTIDYVDFANMTKIRIPVIFRYTGNNVVVDKNGDAYVQTTALAGSRFQDPINTLIKGGAPSFKVAPFIGYNAKRPDFKNTGFILFDETNERFMGWSSAANQGMTTFALTGGTKFDYNIGMKLLYMDGTAFGEGVAFAVMKDKEGGINVCGLLALGNGKGATPITYSQASYYPKINAPEIANAKYFAFHSQYPLMYYATDNAVYVYNLGTKASAKVLTMDNEIITKIKFNLYGSGQSDATLEILNKQTDAEFMAQQYQLIVCSYKTGNEVDGGSFRMYTTNSVDGSLTKKREWNGFAKIVDVVYRERRANYNEK